jgi:hypothetical protein
MNPGINELAISVLKKPLHECSLDELQQIAEQYPYFGPVQLLLAKKLSTASIDDADISGQYEEQVQKASLYFQNRPWLHHLLNDTGNIGSAVSDHSIIVEKETTGSDEEQNRPGEVIVNENREVEIIHEAVIIQQPGVPVEVPATRSEELAEINSNKEEQSNFVAGEEKTTLQTEPHFEIQPLKNEPFPSGGSLLFEPYHTVDYFASQGIKFKEEEKPKDRFGIQLKSFTEWLKTLKQVNVAEIGANIDSSAEKKVEQMAEYSVAERHIITEAMADVWKKQGNKARAEEIYRKLSLLDPSKSSYFAAKIEELKKTS